MLLKNLRPANDYDRFATETLEPWDLLFISRIRQLARGMTPGVIADIGTATGVVPVRLATDPAMRGWRYVGIDLDPAMLDEGRPRIHALDLDDTIEMRVGDALALPFDDGTLTMAVGRATLHHLPDKALSLTEMYRVLEPGGIALVHDMRRDAPQHLLDRFTEMRAAADYPPTHVEERSRSTKRVRSSPKPVSRKSRRSIAERGNRRARLRDPAEETGAGLVMTDLAFLAAHAAARRRRRALLGGRARRDAAAVRDAAQLELATSPEMFVAWYRSRLDTIDTLLDACGALLWRGFAVPDTAAFGQLGALYPPHANGYTAGAAPRKQIDGQVYESTRMPPPFKIGLHREMAYMPAFPRLVAFYCRQPADAGGETPICDMRRVTARVPAALRERFAERGVMYLRNFAAPGARATASPPIRACRSPNTTGRGTTRSARPSATRSSGCARSAASAAAGSTTAA